MFIPDRLSTFIAPNYVATTFAMATFPSGRWACGFGRLDSHHGHLGDQINRPCILSEEAWFLNRIMNAFDWRGNPSSVGSTLFDGEFHIIQADLIFFCKESIQLLRGCKTHRSGNHRFIIPQGSWVSSFFSPRRTCRRCLRATDGEGSRWEHEGYTWELETHPGYSFKLGLMLLVAAASLQPLGTIEVAGKPNTTGGTAGRFVFCLQLHNAWVSKAWSLMQSLLLLAANL